MPEIFGNTAGLSPVGTRSLERVLRRRVPLSDITTPELTRSLCDASRETKRQVGALVHRSGSVEWVVVGSATGLMLPDVGRLRAAQGRFRGLRLVHTHLYGEPLTHDDLVDLTRLRLDLVCAIQLTPAFEPRGITWAHNIPERENSDENETSKPYDVSGPFPMGRVLPDFGALITSLEEEFARQTHVRRVEQQRAMLVHVSVRKGASSSVKANSSLRELWSLAETAGVKVVDQVLQLRDQIDPKWVLGKGKLEDVVMRAIDRDVNVLIFDRELSPTQASAIASQTDLHVIDRTQLILDIFAQRAETNDGKLQVELAQLKYRLPRLGQKDDALSRLTGGIGGRGPGETKLEIGRRRARERVTRLERELTKLTRQREQRRRKRGQSVEPVIAIVGYTNAGKSTLLNTLTGALVLAEDKLFATLDTRARRLALPNGKIAILTDTVGFIRDMPKDLFAAFKATFEEAADADLLLEVVDSSNPEQDQHEQTTESLLRQLELEHIPRLTVRNKVDLLTPEERAAVTADPRSVGLSALDARSTTVLLERLVAELAHCFTEHSTEPQPVASIESQWLALTSALLKRDPSLEFRRPASALALTNIETELGRPLPDELHQLYRLNDGQSHPTNDSLGLLLLSLAQSQSVLRSFQHLLEEDPDAQRVVQEQEFDVQDGMVQFLKFHRLWWPVFQTQDDYVCVDLDPGPSGIGGQLVLCGPKVKTPLVIAPALSEFVSWWSNELERNSSPLEEATDAGHSTTSPPTFVELLRNSGALG
jgi:GTPase